MMILVGCEQAMSGSTKARPSRKAKAHWAGRGECRCTGEDQSKGHEGGHFN